MERPECAEQSRLFDRYSRAVTFFGLRFEALKRDPHKQSETDWLIVERARAESETAWKALEAHIAAHQCLGLGLGLGGLMPRTAGSDSSSELLGRAAEAALDAIVVADGERRFMAVNDAAVEILGTDRSKILGRRIEEFFSSARGETIPAAWRSFIADGVQAGICELSGPEPRRRFEFRAKSNFEQGVHLSVLREIKPDRSHH